MPLWLQAGLWGWLAGGALLIGAALGWTLRHRPRLVASVMAFGAGVLISALAFNLMDEAYHHGGFWPTAVGFLAGAAVYSVADLLLSRRGAFRRKRSAGQPSESDERGSGLAIALGALMDGIPESIAIGVSLLRGGAVSWVTVIAVFLSNIPEGWSSSAGMKKAGRRPGYVFGTWIVIAFVSGLASVVGAVVFSGVAASVVSGTVAVAAGAILAMLADTMMPEAFEAAHDLVGFVTVLGFLAAFALSKLG